MEEIPYCQRCCSTRIIRLAVNPEMFCISSSTKVSTDNSILEELNIGQSGMILQYICLNCGQLQGIFPKYNSSLEDF